MAGEQDTTALKNTVTVEEAGPCKRRVSVEIPEEAIKKATDEQYESLRKEAMVPGFRKGRAPRRLLEKRFGKETSEQIKLKLLADATDSAVKDNNLDTLSEPDIDFEKVELPDTGPLKFDFEVEVRPEFELPSLDGIPVQKVKLEITDEQIAGEIEQLRKWSGVWMPRDDGAVELEDKIIADVVFKAEEIEQETKLDNIEIYVRPNGFVGAIAVERLDELLTGAAVDEVRKTTVDVPKTYFREEYRGKKVDIQITVKDIKWLKPAALDENFLNKYGVKDEKELRERMHDGLKSRFRVQERNQMSEQIYRYMLDNTDFDLPLDFVGQQANQLLQRQYASLLRQGLTGQQIEERMEQLKAGSEQQTKEQLKAFFVMDKVADKLKIKVSEEELNGHIAQLAVQRGQRPERLREQMLRDGSLAQFRLQLREDKCISQLLESAKITEVKAQEKAEKTAAKTKTTKKAATPGKKRETTTKKKADK